MQSDTEQMYGRVNKKERADYLCEWGLLEFGSYLKNIWKPPLKHTGSSWGGCRTSHCLPFNPPEPPFIQMVAHRLRSLHPAKRWFPNLQIPPHEPPRPPRGSPVWFWPPFLPIKRWEKKRWHFHRLQYIQSKWLMISDVSKCYFIVIASFLTIFKPNVSAIILCGWKMILRREATQARGAHKYLSSSFSPVFGLRFLFKSGSGGFTGPLPSDPVEYNIKLQGGEKTCSALK